VVKGKIMALSNEAKKAYQKEYMRKQREKARLAKNPIIKQINNAQDKPQSTNGVRPDMLDPENMVNVRPEQLNPVRPDVIPILGRESHKGLVDAGDVLVPGNKDIYQRPTAADISLTLKAERLSLAPAISQSVKTICPMMLWLRSIKTITIVLSTILKTINRSA